MDTMFVDACTAGNIAEARLLPSPTHGALLRALRYACFNGHLEVAQ